jgi:D-threo-aldose 1-dehydrogenase
VIRQVLEESLPTLNRLKTEGRIDAIGLGINEWDVGYEILASADVDCVLIAGRYTLLDASGFTSGFMDACGRRGVSVLAGGVFNSGFLTGGNHYAYQKAIGPVVEARQRLTSICERYGVALPAVALQFTAAHPAITSVVVGARSAAEVEAIVRWSRERVPSALWSELRATGFIPEDAPAPATGD